MRNLFLCFYLAKSINFTEKKFSKKKNTFNIVLNPPVMMHDSKFILPLERQLKIRIGKKFTPSEKQSIFNKLESMPNLSELDEAILLIEQGDNSDSLICLFNYGLILAICYAAHKPLDLSEIKKTKQIMKSLDTFSQCNKLRADYQDYKKSLGNKVYSQTGTYQLLEFLEDKTHHHEKNVSLNFFPYPIMRYAHQKPI